MKKIIKAIVNFFKSIFGIKDKPIEIEEPQVTPPVKDSGTTEGNNTHQENVGTSIIKPTNGVIDTITDYDSANTEYNESQEENDCPKLRIVTNSKPGKHGKITFKILKKNGNLEFKP